MPNELYATSLIFHFIAETTAFPESLCYSEETMALRGIGRLWTTVLQSKVRHYRVNYSTVEWTMVQQIGL